MIVFWLVCGVLIMIALAFILPPLGQSQQTSSPNVDEAVNLAVYRDQISELDSERQKGVLSDLQYQQDRNDIERRLLEDVSELNELPKSRSKVSSRGVVYATAIALPVLAVLLYLRIGNVASFSTSTTLTDNVAQSKAPNLGSSMRSQERIEENVAVLAQRLEQNPDDAQGWIMLARSYNTLEKYSQAAAAYAKATTLKPGDADLWADYAFVAAMANGKSLQGQPSEFITKALAIDPENPKALELAGSAAFEAKNYKQAVEYWEKLSGKTPPDSELGQILAKRVLEAKKLAAEK